MIMSWDGCTAKRTVCAVQLYINLMQAKVPLEEGMSVDLLLMWLTVGSPTLEPVVLGSISKQVEQATRTK